MNKTQIRKEIIKEMPPNRLPFSSGDVLIVNIAIRKLAEYLHSRIMQLNEKGLSKGEILLQIDLELQEIIKNE